LSEEVTEEMSLYKGSMYKVMLFVSGGCMNPLTSTGCTSPDIGDNANLVLEDISLVI